MICIYQNKHVAKSALILYCWASILIIERHSGLILKAHFYIKVHIIHGPGRLFLAGNGTYWAA